MKYFRNTELAKIYNVSEKSVRNWIQAAQDGKLDLQLYEKNDKFFVANITKNNRLIEVLVEKGKKYKNSRGYKTISPGPKFYEIFEPKQIYDIISNLTIHHELPLKYSYVDGGADYWDKYTFRLFSEEGPNMLRSTIELIDSNFDYLDRLLKEHRKVNVVDLGPGNALPAKNLLNHLLLNGKLNRYIGIDVSKEMLQVANKHIKEWFGDKIKLDAYIRDFNHERFDDIFAKDYTNEDIDAPINLVLLLGGTLCNLRNQGQALQTINDSLGVNDIFLYSTKLDTPSSRRFFDFNISAEAQELAPRHKLTLDLLNIDKSLYEVEQLFDQQRQARLIKIRPKVALSLRLELSNGIRRIDLNKDQGILLWRYWHQGAIEIINQFDQNNYDILKAEKSKDMEFILLVNRLKVGD